MRIGQTDFFAKYYERTKCCWYCKVVTDKTLAICTRSLAGNLRLWRFTANVSSLSAMTVKAESMKQEWDIKVLITFYQFSVTVQGMSDYMERLRAETLLEVVCTLMIACI